ncbi:alpha/beta fold hydrolase [Herbiconiux liukaitaii]|uniref:alpha/beta fold hydrolase n=1 Tax=Herbiconiux liukaitaii TaxID=3342799 RepID=UPI0035B8E851
MTRTIATIPLLLVHGWAGSAESWSSVLPALRAEGFALVTAVRLPGSPGADPHGAPTVRDAAAKLVQTAALLPERPLLVGHSMGAQVTLLAHQILGEKIAGEVVIDPAYGSDSTQEKAAIWADRIDRDGHVAVRDFFESALGERMSADDRANILHDVDHTASDVIATYLRSEYSADDSIGLRSQTGLAAALRSRPVLAIHSTPHGAESEATLPAPEGSRVEQWPGYGHYLHLEDPSRFASSVAAFAKSLVSTGSMARA